MFLQACEDAGGGARRPAKGTEAKVWRRDDGLQGFEGLSHIEDAQTMENKQKHLELIQGVINRLSSNSFLLKGWSVVLISALFPC